MRVSGLIAAAMFAAVAVVARAAPLEAYGNLPNVEQAELSPDGTKAAFIYTDGDQRRLAVRDLADGRIVNVINTGDAKVRYLQWAGPQHLIITPSRTALVLGLTNPRDEYTVPILFDLKTNKSRVLMQGGEAEMNTTFGPAEVRVVDGKTVIYLRSVVFTGGQGVHSIFRAELDRAGVKLVNQGEANTIDWVIDAEGAPIAQALYERNSGRWTLRLRPDRNATWKAVERRTDKLNYPDLVGLAASGRAVLVGEEVDDEYVIREIGLDGAWGPVVARGGQWPIFDPLRHNMIGLTEQDGDERVTRYLEPRDDKVWKAVLAAYPGERVGLSSWSDDRRKFIVRVESPVEPPAYAMVDLKTGKADWLAFEYEKLTRADVAPVKPISFKAADGLELHGYLTTPRGKEAKNLPLIVFPHGGPAARDTLSFDWWAQGMASRGYAVLQVNFRGSTGYGKEHLEAGFGEWGRKMQTDLSDGVRHLAKDGVIDPKRVCIVGASYGGYAALAGAALDADVYRCAVSVAGISDLRRFVTWSRVQNSISAQRYWVNFMGAEDPRDPVLTQISPAAQASRIKAPVLLLHGKDDTVVPLEQSRIMADAMKAAGKPVELTVMAGEDHWLSRSASRLQTLQATVAFIEKHNPPN